MSTIRALLVVAAMNQWHTCINGCAKAFLHGELKEEIYMHIPLGYKMSSSSLSQRECDTQ